jgi:hypothetical protein
LLSPSSFPTNNLRFCSPIRATCPANLTVLDFIILILQLLSTKFRDLFNISA